MTFTHFTLASTPSLVFEVRRRYLEAGIYDSVIGVLKTKSGKIVSTSARVADVVKCDA
jgi:hypothetical protein